MRGVSRGIIAGFDCHADHHVAAVLDPLGRLLGTNAFMATSDGYREARVWLDSFGHVIAVGVESTGSFGAALARSLNDHGLRVIEVNQPHPHTKERRGKDDTIDAEAAARKVLSGEVRGAAKETRGVVEAMRQLTVARDGAIKARTAALCQLGDLMVTSPEQVRKQLESRKTRRARRLCVSDCDRPRQPSQTRSHRRRSRCVASHAA